MGLLDDPPPECAGLLARLRLFGTDEQIFEEFENPQNWQDWRHQYPDYYVGLFRVLYEHGRKRKAALQAEETTRQTEEAARRAEAAHQVQPAEERSAPSRTGAPGRPSSMHLVDNEFHRRCQAREVLETLTAESEYLSQWLKDTHPAEPRLKAKSISNKLRSKYQAFITSKE